MRIVDTYSLNNAYSLLKSEYSDVLSTIEETLDNIKLENIKRITSKEKNNYWKRVFLSKTY